MVSHSSIRSKKSFANLSSAVVVAVLLASSSANAAPAGLQDAMAAYNAGIPTGDQTWYSSAVAAEGNSGASISSAIASATPSAIVQQLDASPLPPTSVASASASADTAVAATTAEDQGLGQQWAQAEGVAQQIAEFDPSAASAVTSALAQESTQAFDTTIPAFRRRDGIWRRQEAAAPATTTAAATNTAASTDSAAATNTAAATDSAATTNTAAATNTDRNTRLNSSHSGESRMPSSA